MINSATFRNFKSLRDVTMTFDSRLTIIVGPNGSGKTSILQGIGILCNLWEKRVESNYSEVSISKYINRLGAPTNFFMELKGIDFDSIRGINVNSTSFGIGTFGSACSLIQNNEGRRLSEFANPFIHKPICKFLSFNPRVLSKPSQILPQIEVEFEDTGLGLASRLAPLN